MLQVNTYKTYWLIREFFGLHSFPTLICMWKFWVFAWFTYNFRFRFLPDYIIVAPSMYSFAFPNPPWLLPFILSHNHPRTPTHHTTTINWDNFFVDLCYYFFKSTKKIQANQQSKNLIKFVHTFRCFYKLYYWKEQNLYIF